MTYLIVSNKPPKKHQKCWGDGLKSQEQCLKLLTWASNNRDREDTSITVIAKETGVPRMTVHWILEDAKARKNRSTLVRVARANGYWVKVAKSWNTVYKYKRKKNILNAFKRE